MPKKRLVGSGNAVKNECRECFGSRWKSCLSMICKLNDKTISVRKRIRLHCLDCVGTSYEIEKCTGRLLFGKRLCFLHPYRFRKEKIEKWKKQIIMFDSILGKYRTKVKEHKITNFESGVI